MNRRASDLETGIRAPLRLAGEFAASRHATIRHYVDHHSEPLGLLIIGQYPDAHGGLPVFMWSQSPEFESRFGQARDHLASPSVIPFGDPARSEFARLQAQAKAEGTSDRGEIALVDRDGRHHDFILEVHFNGRVHLAMVSPKRRIRLGRRLVATTDLPRRFTLRAASAEP
jgi:hypothetical protein